MFELLEIGIAMPYIAEVLTEVFTGGPEICLDVKEEQVERIFSSVTAGVTEGQAGELQLIVTLQAMAKVL